MPIESHIDDQPFASGTHAQGGNSAVLVNPGKDFWSCGVAVGALVKNTTDGSEGTITARTEDTVTATLAGGTDNDWDVGDSYEIYNTGTEDSYISKAYVDRSRGWQVFCPEELDEEIEWLVDDVDKDEFDDLVWGPGQPSTSHRGI